MKLEKVKPFLHFLYLKTGLGVHLITVNDYLGKRDKNGWERNFQFHGLSIDCIDNHTPNSEERRQHIYKILLMEQIMNLDLII